VFSSVVVPLDLSTAADRALPVARSLAQLGGLPIELVTVRPTEMGGRFERWDLDERVRSMALGPTTAVVLESDDAGAAIIEHVSGRDGALLVMATTAKAALDEDYAGGVSERVLSELRQPVLLVGPRVNPAPPSSAPSVVAGVDGSSHARAALPVIVSWTRTFGGTSPTFVEVIPFVPAIAEQAGRALEAAHVQDCVARLARSGVEARGEVIYGDDAATALASYTEHVENGLLVVTAERWAGAGTHWRSTSRKLAYRSPCPVLIVAADLAPTPDTR
jgi:nucleotide-binding universal stress UspA family protein